MPSKIAYLKSFGLLHSYFRVWGDTPPEGYRFLSKDYFGRLVNGKNDKNLLENWMKPIMRKVNMPDKLLGAFATYFDAPPDGSNLTITNGLLNFRHEPWIPVIYDAISSLIGHPYDLRLTHPLVENTLARDDCKAIIYFFEATRKSLESTYYTSGFESKLEYVPLGTPAIPKRYRPKKRNINIVFLGSANFTQDGFNDVWFYNRGGHIVIKAFMRLCSEFDNISLTIRSQLPPEYRRVLEQDPRIVIVDNPIPQQELDELLWIADIFLLPVRDSPFQSFLDAMNHELPIITTHTNANSEIVHDGKWGIVCEVPAVFRSIIDDYHIPSKDLFGKMWKAWIQDNQSITDAIVEALRVLIRDESLRRQMGMAGRKMIESPGLFSVERRNSYLKRVLDRVAS